MDLVLLHSFGYPGYGLFAAPAETLAGTRFPALAVPLIALACSGVLLFSPYLRKVRKQRVLRAPSVRTLSLAAAAVLLGLSALVFRMIV